MIPEQTVSFSLHDERLRKCGVLMGIVQPRLSLAREVRLSAIHSLVPMEMFEPQVGAVSSIDNS